MTRRPERAMAMALKAVGALALLVTGLIGVPAGLVRLIGWPLPRTAPSWEELRDSLSGASISDDVILRP